MSVLTQEMKELIERVRFCNAATASRDGQPNVSPKGSITWLDDATLAFCEYNSIHTRENLKQNPQIAISLVDPQKLLFMQFKGKAELTTEGEQYKKAVERARAKSRSHGGPELPDPTNVVLIKVAEVHRFPPA